MLMQRFVAPVVDGLPEEPSSSSGPVVRSLQTARAPRESSDEYLDSSSPVEVMRKRLRVLRAPVWGTKKHTCGVVHWRDK